LQPVGLKTQNADFRENDILALKINMLITKNLQFIKGLSPTNSYTTAGFGPTFVLTLPQTASWSSRLCKPNGRIRLIPPRATADRSAFIETFALALFPFTKVIDGYKPTASPPAVMASLP
jgi:hypothetical protein